MLRWFDRLIHRLRGRQRPQDSAEQPKVVLSIHVPEQAGPVLSGDADDKTWLVWSHLTDSLYELRDTRGHSTVPVVIDMAKLDLGTLGRYPIWKDILAHYQSVKRLEAAKPWLSL